MMKTKMKDVNKGVKKTFKQRHKQRQLYYYTSVYPQDEGLKEYISSLISTGESYTEFLTLLTNALDGLE